MLAACHVAGRDRERPLLCAGCLQPLPEDVVVFRDGLRNWPE